MSKLFKLVVNRSAIFIASMFLLAGVASAQEQTVSGSLSVAELSAGQSSDLIVSYTGTDADGVNSYAVGLGLRLHFDSSVLDMGETSKKLFTGALPFQIKDDTSDFDNDASTDKFLLTSWAETVSGEGWPAYQDQATGEMTYVDMPVELYTVPLTAVSGFNGSTLKFTASSTAAGYSLAATDVAIGKIPGTVSTLSGLTASYPAAATAVTAIALTPTFASDVVSYTATVANPVSEVTLAP